MLDWTECSEGWRSDGFRIVLAEPFRWLLLDEENQPDQSAVSVGWEPLAVARSLTEAKREAELIASARARAEVRKRHFLTLLLAGGVALLLLGGPITGNELPLLVAGIVAVRSTAILLGTLLPTAFGMQHEVFYQ